GSNGSGKSSIIKTILGEQDLKFTGEVYVAPSVKIGYLPQIINFENEKQELLDYFKHETSVGEERARSILAQFRFDKEDVKKRIGGLSGGERIRVRLAVLLQQQINTLIFDEPTNHIDISTKESLEESMEEFDGTLIFISHDRFFINKFAQKVIEVDSGKTTTYLGNYEDYIRSKKKRR
ncbi:MAG: ATP-binding cassette domain-containing protein, partial [Firmicutes bacterium]|nr:ATP-binding cassette domain-containing protein [Bacillota bacterium]